MKHRSKNVWFAFFSNFHIPSSQNEVFQSLPEVYSCSRCPIQIGQTDACFITQCSMFLAHVPEVGDDSGKRR